MVTNLLEVALEKSKKLVWCLILYVFASASAYAEEHFARVDPWESWNRKVFAFNETADKYVIKPVARGYKKVTPQFLDDGVSNVFYNLGEILTVINDLLQFKFGDATKDTGRFVVNTTVGLVGFFDVAEKIGLEKGQEDFGQTFATWGVGAGPYLILPLLGPSTTRNAVSLLPDSYANPIRYIDHVPTRNTVYVVGIVDKRADFIEAEEIIQGDRYLFLRDAYLQRREFLIMDGAVVDDFGDEDF